VRGFLNAGPPRPHEQHLRLDRPDVSASSTAIVIPTEPETPVEASTSAQASSGVLIHCDQGISRSATIVVAYLMRKHRAKLEDVLAAVRAKRKVKPSPNFVAQLEIWEQVGYQIWEDVEKKIPKKLYLAYTKRRAADLKAKGLTGNEPIRPLNL
jgi:Dual specificity phosphatase, catalytic domain